MTQEAASASAAVPAANWRDDDRPYVLPYAVFLAITLSGGLLPARLHPIVYATKTAAAAGLLITFRRLYTPIRWNGWWLGAIVGAVGIALWVGMQYWLQRHFGWFRPGSDVFDPRKAIGSTQLVRAYVGLRLVDAVVVVPVMEELFWRDYVWRQVLSPHNFRRAAVGQWSWRAWLVASCLFATVHGNWWLTAIAWAMMIGLLLAYTRSLGACIVAHAVTNLLLVIYVLKSGDWTLL